MIIIFFNLGLVLAFILLVSIVFINASTKFVLAILGVTCILFLIKNIIQDCIMQPQSVTKCNAKV